MPVTHNAQSSRFETEVGTPDPAILAYQRLADGTLDLQHTLVPSEARGEGVADSLVKAAVEYAKAEGVHLIPTCPYVAAWVARHPGERAVFAAD